jgi:AraC family transcriptional regulator
MSVFRTLNMEILESGDENSLFDERETQVHHSPYQWEQILVRSIRDGNIPMVERFLSNAIRNGTKVGKLSANELRQAQYMAVVFAHQASRAAIQGGMFEADAYNKCDAFIQKVDKETSPEVVLELTQQAMREWTKEVHEIKLHRNFSPQISACLEYIYNNLHSRISLSELAKVSCLSATYLSALFKKEVGVNISTYILRQKVKTAQEMLSNTKHSTKDIGYYLNFSSQSYFINCFKRECGVTPRQFRLRAFSSENSASLSK